MNRINTTLVFVLLSLAPYGFGQNIRGFIAPEKQQQLEQSFDNAIDADHIGHMIMHLSSRQHHLGSAGSKWVAE